MNFQIVVLFLALILFGVLAFKRISALILGPVVTIFVLIFSSMPILDSLLGPFMESAASYVQKYFFVFFVGALFGAIYQHTGAAASIAKAIVKLSHGKFVAPIVMIITGILTFGGVSGFVVFFAVYPIAVVLFKKSNLSRILIPASISAGCWTWSMNAPGSPSIQNVIPMRNLETTASAAFIPGLAAAITEFVLIFIWLELRSRYLTKKGKFFDDSSLTPLSPEELVEDDEDLPNPILSAIPIALILITFNLPNGYGFPVETAVMTGVLSATVLFFRRIPKLDKWIDIFNQGASNSGSAILNTAIVVGFAGVVQKTSGFTQLIDGLKGMNMSPLIFVAITTAIAAGAAGSASGGLGIAFDALKNTYMSMGVSAENIHRIAAISAGTLDSLPHQGAQITLLGICKLTHKDAYMDIAITQILIPAISVFCVCIPLAAMGL